MAAPKGTLMVAPLALLVVSPMANLAVVQTAVQAALIVVLVDITMVAPMNVPPILNRSLGSVL